VANKSTTHKRTWPKAGEPAPLLDLPSLIPAWQRTLRVERKAPGTITTYGSGVKAFLKWCDTSGTNLS